MDSILLSKGQEEILQQDFNTHIFVEGPAGCGKTTVGVNRLLELIHTGVPADQILIIAPQRTLAFPYYQMLLSPDLPAGSTPTIATIGGLAQRTIDIFWPAVARLTGFGNPDQPPIFLTLETAQYYMARLVTPLLEKGYFDAVDIDRNRLFSQILDNLNKAAAIGFPHTEFGERLQKAWVGKPTQLRVYEEAQECANLFRNYCLENNLLDFSLQLELFTTHLWNSDLCRQYLLKTYRHVIYENIEEDIPVAHDILREWLPNFDSALLICDADGGYRSFLGADPDSAHSLSEICDQHFILNESFVTSPVLNDLQNALADSLQRRESYPSQDIPSIIHFSNHQFYPQMVKDICDQIAQLIHEEGTLPGEIVVLAPFLTDSLRFSLMNQLDHLGIPYRSHRPSRSLREEPAAQCLLTLAKLAHPEWGLFCSRHELRSALIQSIADLDLIRADILAQIVYQESKPENGLSSFEKIDPKAQNRITYTLGARYEELREWLARAQNTGDIPLDVFISKLFGEILSQPGFGFHNRFDAAGVAARLIESIQKFRWVTGPSLEQEEVPIGKEYIQMVDQGVVAAQYLQSWSSQPEDAVLLAPAYTFLMANFPVTHQFWLDIGSTSWWERLDQPLTHPYVLSRQWPPNMLWTDINEHEANQLTLERLVRGLIRRCSGNIYLYTTDTNEQGNQQRGPLLQAAQILLRRIHLARGGQDV